MSEAPRDGTVVRLWAGNPALGAIEGSWHKDAEEWRGNGSGWDEANFVGWTPIVRPLEPNAPEPDRKPRCGVCGDTHVMELRENLVPCTHCPMPCSRCAAGAYCATPHCLCDCHGGEKAQVAPEPESLPPSKQRATFQLFSAAQEAVALGQSVGEFLALASVAHAQATKRAELVKEGGDQ